MSTISCQLAVVPALLGPMQSLMLVLPQIALAMALVAQWLVSPLAWRQAVRRLWQTARTKPLTTLVYLVGMAMACGGAWWLLMPAETRARGDIAGGNDLWLTFHGGGDRCGVATGANPRIPSEPKLMWRFRDALMLERRPFAGSPAIAGSSVIIGSDNYKVYCIDTHSGRLRWVFEAGNPVFSSPAAWNGRVYIGEGLHFTTDAKLHCLDLRDGRLLWSYRTTSHVESSPALADGYVYFGAGDDGLICLDAITGAMAWQHKGPHVDCGPLVADERVYFGSGYGTDAVHCISTKTGQPIWRKDLPAPLWGAVSIADGRLYFGLGNGTFEESDDKPLGEVRCLNATDGSEIWRFTQTKDSVLTSVAVAGGRAVFGCRDGAVYALDAASGARVWRTEVDAPVLSTPAIAAGRVLFGVDDGKFRCLDLTNGRPIWLLDTSDDVPMMGGEVRIQSSPAVADGKVIFGAANGNVYCLSDDIAAQGTVAASQHRSRLMRGADLVTMGLMRFLARLTGSLGMAIILTAAALRLILLPLDWRQAAEMHKLQGIENTARQLRLQTPDYRVRRFETRRLYEQAGVRPLSVLMPLLVQLPLIIIVFFIVQSAPDMDGKAFLWSGNLANPDRLVRLPAMPLMGQDMNLLPIVLMVSVWVFAATMQTPANRPRVAWHAAWAMVAIVLGILTYRWSAGILWFTVAMLWTGIIEQQAFRVVGLAQSRGGNA